MGTTTFTQLFIESVKDMIGENLPYVLGFAALIIGWQIAKKWVFGGAGRV